MIEPNSSLFIICILTCALVSLPPEGTVTLLRKLGVSGGYNRSEWTGMQTDNNVARLCMNGS